MEYTWKNLAARRQRQRKFERRHGAPPPTRVEAFQWATHLTREERYELLHIYGCSSLSAFITRIPAEAEPPKVTRADGAPDPEEVASIWGKCVPQKDIAQMRQAVSDEVDRLYGKFSGEFTQL